MKLPPLPNRSRKAFSLVELLAVLAVVGILAAILIPAVSKVRTKANLTESLSQLRQIGSALSLYSAQNDGKLPVPSNMVQQDNPNRTHWALQIGRREDFFGAPTTFIHQTLIAPNINYENPSGGFRGIDDTYLTYSATGSMCAIRPDGSLDFTEARGSNQWEDPAKNVLMFLAKQRPAKDGYCRTVHPRFADVSSDVQATGSDGTSVLNFAYNDTMPILMADGSVRALGFEERDFLTAERWEGRER